MFRRINSTSNYYGLIIILLALSFATLLWLPRPVKKIGHWAIYKEDIQWRDTIIQSFFPNAKPGAGLKQLKKSAAHLKVLENNGVTITREEILAEARRIKENSRNPEHLKKIKNLFAGNEEAYFKNYVLPTLVDRIIAFEFFPNNAEIHRESLSKAQRLIDKSQNKKQPFVEIAKNLNIPTKNVSLSLEQGLVWEDEEENSKKKKRRIIDRSPKKNPGIYRRVRAKLEPREGRGPEAQFWINKIIDGLEPGEIVAKPINQEGSWWVVQYRGQENEKNFKLIIAEIEKIDYGTWLTGELKKVEGLK